MQRQCERRPRTAMGRARLGARVAALATGLGLLAACIGVPAAGADAPIEGRWKARLDAALGAPALRGAQLGVLVIDRGDGSVLYEHQPARPLIPASNQKIFTGLAALASLGPSYRFTTWIGADAAPDGNGSVRNLYVRGGGDPALTSEEWFRLASDLRRAGLSHVMGDLVVDDGRFDAVRWHADWGPVSLRAYHAPIGALAANYGAFSVEVAPGFSANVPARVMLDPPVDYLTLANRVETGPPGTGKPIEVSRAVSPSGERVAVTGRAALGDEPVLLYRSVSDPALYAASVLAWQLRSLGIEVSGIQRRGKIPDRAQELLAYEGRPLAEVTRLLLKYSSNPVAESLVKALGVEGESARGSWESGLAAMRSRLKALGIDLRGARLRDGSGLSRSNRATARQLVQALWVADRDFRVAPEFLAALPVLGEDGTLRERGEALRGTVRAKTGHLDGVTTLSGLARLESGREVLFSLLANGGGAGLDSGRLAVDAFLSALIRDSFQERAARRTE